MFNRHKQFLIYFFILSICTFLDYVTVYILNLYFGIVVYAITIGHILSVSINYTLQKYFTFQEKKLFDGVQIFRYLCVVFIIWLITVCIVELSMFFLHWHIIASKLLAQPFTFIVGFFLMKYFVFPIKKE